MRCLLVSAIVLVAGTTSAEAILMGQLDDFQDGSLQGWNAWYDVSIMNIASDGPDGSADRYLAANTQISSTDAGILFTNGNQWRGNYIKAGVSSIEMDLRNPSNMALTVNITIVAPNYGTFTSVYAATLPPDNQWYHATFSLLEEDVVKGSPLDNYDGAFRYVNWLGIGYQSIDTSGTGSDYPLSMGLDIDNIHALPEPSTCMTMLLLSLIGQRLIARMAHSPTCRGY